jgi:hypothetical protein
LVNYCTTVYKAQGANFTEDYTIWDYNKMCNKLKYTALSRAKSVNQINFINYEIKAEEANDSVIKRKFDGHVKSDAIKGFNTDIDVDYIKNMIEYQGNSCYHCGVWCFKVF